MILAQGMLVLLLVLIAMRHPRYAAYLFTSAVVVAVMALATDVTDVGLLLGETLPFYAVIFMLAWGRAPTPRTKESGAGRSTHPGSGCAD
jgi:F0F1-type ATP synthase membrane subunit c/vacuolar-type H+-ATPase subunit K